MPLGAFKAALMGTAGVSTGDVVLIQSQTASNSATISFTSGIDSTYGEYIFRFYNINPATDATFFAWQANASGQSGYNETITSTFFYAQHSSAENPNLEYDGDHDQAQGTAFQRFAREVGGAADESLVGELHLFNPSSTTFVKHFHSRTEHHNDSAYAMDSFAAGYINVTAAITNVQFKMESGNFDGKIKMWGVK